MCLIYFREINDGLTVDADGACEKDTLPLPKFKPQRVPGPQLPIRSRVDGSQFTTQWLGRTCAMRNSRIVLKIGA